LNLLGETEENHKNLDQVRKYMGLDFKKISPNKNLELQLGAGTTALTPRGGYFIRLTT
jgi:hypothetical protein